MFPRSEKTGEPLCAIVSRGPTTGRIVPILATDEPRIVRRVVEAFADVLINDAGIPDVHDAKADAASEADLLPVDRGDETVS